MGQFRTTADLVTAILTRAGEPTNGNSSYQARALDYANKIHMAVIAGGTVFEIDVDETWTWAKAKRPMVVQLLPKYDSGGVNLTNGSSAGTFSAAPAISLQNYYIQGDADREIYKIVSHTASTTAFQLDANYVGSTVSGKAFKAFLLDYVLSPQLLYVDSTNDLIEFKALSTVLTATLTHGSFTPAGLATEVQTRMQAADVTNTYTVSYSGTSRKFTISSNLSGPGAVLQLFGLSGTNPSRSGLPLLGFDTLDFTGTGTYTGAYVIDGICRLVEPFRVYKGSSRDADIYGIDELTFHNEYPVTDAIEEFPRRFAKVSETPDGSIRVRFDRYVKDATKIEIEYIPIPRDLQNNSASIPLLPRKYADILEYGAASFILVDKENDKAQVYSALATKQLLLMQKHNRQEQTKTGLYFGEIVPRPDKTQVRHKLRYGYTAEDP